MVLEWQIIGVALFCNINSASGLPTILLLLIIATFFPSSETSYAFSSISIPLGVHGINVVSPVDSLPADREVNPSTSFLGLIMSKSLLSSPFKFSGKGS